MGTGKPFGQNAATSYRHANEKQAAKSYLDSLANLQEDLHIDECGLLDYKDYSYIGGSIESAHASAIHPGQ